MSTTFLHNLCKKKNPNQKPKPKYQPKTCKTKEGQKTSTYGNISCSVIFTLF